MTTYEEAVGGGQRMAMPRTIQFEAADIESNDDDDDKDDAKDDDDELRGSADGPLQTEFVTEDTSSEDGEAVIPFPVTDADRRKNVVNDDGGQDERHRPPDCFASLCAWNWMTLGGHCGLHSQDTNAPVDY